jgi:hypothetical protein
VRLARSKRYESECVTKSAKILAASVLMAITACSYRTTTNAALASEAQHAVDSKLGGQGEFTLGVGLRRISPAATSPHPVFPVAEG